MKCVTSRALTVNAVLLLEHTSRRRSLGFPAVYTRTGALRLPRRPLSGLTLNTGLNTRPRTCITSTPSALLTCVIHSQEVAQICG